MARTVAAGRSLRALKLLPKPRACRSPAVAVTVLAIMIALLCISKTLRLERLWANEVSMSAACDAEEPASAKADPAEFGRWSMCVAAIASAPVSALSDVHDAA